MDFNPLISANRSSLEQSNITAERLAQLGQQVGQSIAINNYRQQAQEMAPLISQSYGQATQAIANGDIAGGLGQIYQTSAQIAGNPLLAPLAQHATQEGQNMVTQKVISDRAEAGMLSREKIATQRNQYAVDKNAETQLAIDQRQQNRFAQQDKTQQAQFEQQQAQQQRQFDQQLAMQQNKQNAPTNPEERAKLIESVNTNAQKIIGTLGKATTDADFASALERFAPYRKALEIAGADTANPYFDEQAQEHMQSLLGKIDKKQKEIDAYKAENGGKSPPASWFRGDLVKDVKELQGVYDRIAKISLKANKDGYVHASANQGQQQDPNAQPPADNQQPPTVTTKEQYDALPSGAVYISKNGQPHKKP